MHDIVIKFYRAIHQQLHQKFNCVIKLIIHQQDIPGNTSMYTE